MSVRISWVDSSPDQQRRMREIAGLFSEHDAREELGLASVRDGLADILFPGTSTLHTRAKYLLFVPWCYQRALEEAPPDRLQESVRRLERAMIRQFPQDVDRTGLIGARAGDGVKSLPSSLYWGMLTAHRILVPPHTPAARSMHTALEADDVPPMFVSGSVPPAPEGFPQQVPGGFTLSRQEADWLREVLQVTQPESALAHVLRQRPDPSSPALWDDAASDSMPSSARDQLQHTEAFSRFMHGAQLLYNLLLAEAQQDLPNHRQDDDGTPDLREHYRHALDEWSMLAVGAEDWDVEELFALVNSHRRARLPAGVTAFIRGWRQTVITAGPEHIADDGSARDLVATRERRLKGPQSRLHNTRLLSQWSGAAGSSRMRMRWGTVRTLLADIWEAADLDA